MKSYTTLRNLYGDITIDDSSANLTLGDQLINDAIRYIISLPYDWDFTEGSTTDTTVASQNVYDLPYNVGKMKSVTITVGSTVWPLKEVTDRRRWEDLQETSFTSDIPEFFYILNNALYVYPTPASSSNTITMYYKKAARDLSVADYTTGTITVTNGDETITGAGTTFTAAMVGRWLKSNADNYWYEINTFTSTTAVELVKKFQGTTAAGAAYTIGEMPLLPEAFHTLPVYRAASIYYRITEPQKAVKWDELFTDGVKRLIMEHGSKTSNVELNITDAQQLNPNLHINI